MTMKAMVKKWVSGYQWFRPEYKKYANLSYNVMWTTIMVMALFAFVEALTRWFSPDTVGMVAILVILIVGICAGSFATLQSVDKHEKKLSEGQK